MSVTLAENYESYSDGDAVSGWTDISNTWRARTGQAVFGSVGFGAAAHSSGSIAVNTGISAATDMRVRIVQKVNKDGSGLGPNCGIFLRCSDDAQNGYLVLPDFSRFPAVGIVAYKRESGTYTKIDDLSAGTTASDGQAWRLLAEITGTTLRYKIWNADVAEPASWLNSVTDSSISSAGKIGVYNGVNGGGSGSAGRLPGFDELRVGTVGQSFGYTTTDITINSQSCRVLTPTVPAATSLVMIYHHGMGENYTSLTGDSLKQGLIDSAAEQGWVIVASSANGDNIGNDAGLDSYRALLGYILITYPGARVVVLSQSAGGPSGLLSIARGQVTGLVGWVGIYPVTSLSAFFGNNAGTYAPNVRTAYGITSDGSDYAEKTADHDPQIVDPARYPRIRYRTYASTSDTVVPSGTHSTLLLQRLYMAQPIEATLVTCSGTHGDPSHFQAMDFIAFLNRCKADTIDNDIPVQSRTAWANTFRRLTDRLTSEFETIPTAAEVRTEMDDNSTKLDVAVSTRLAPTTANRTLEVGPGGAVIANPVVIRFDMALTGTAGTIGGAPAEGSLYQLRQGVILDILPDDATQPFQRYVNSVTVTSDSAATLTIDSAISGLANGSTVGVTCFGKPQNASVVNWKGAVPSDLADGKVQVDAGETGGGPAITVEMNAISGSKS